MVAIQNFTSLDFGSQYNVFQGDKKIKRQKDKKTKRQNDKKKQKDKDQKERLIL